MLNVINSLLRNWGYRLLAPQALLREQYEALRELLQHDIRCHEQMAELQELFRHGPPEDYASIRVRFEQLSGEVSQMIEALGKMKPEVYADLRAYHRKFDFYTRFLLAPPKIDTTPPYTLQLDSLSPDDHRVGNKARHLSILRNILDVQCPDGFVIPISAFHRIIEHNRLRPAIDEQLATIHIDSETSLLNGAERLTGLILSAEIPDDLREQMSSACSSLAQRSGKDLFAVRSSALGEDSENSFAGQFTTRLNVSRDNILDAYLQVIASKYSPEALYYRIFQGWGDEETAMAVLVMPMIEASVSGVIYTGSIAPGSDQPSSIEIHTVEGLGENLVGGKATASICLLDHQPPFKVSAQEGSQLLSPPDIDRLAQAAVRAEKHFQGPQDLEWALDNEGQLFILQARALQPTRVTQIMEDDASRFTEQIILTGCEQASAGIGAGTIFRPSPASAIGTMPHGAILLTEHTPPDYVRFLHKAAAVLSVHGSRACHLATVAREFAIPFLCGLGPDAGRLNNGDLVTVDGYRGTVYHGILPLEHGKMQSWGGAKFINIVSQAAKFITTLDLVDPTADNFTPDGCRSMHDIIRFCHEKAVQTLFSSAKPGTGRGSRRLDSDIPLDVYLFDVGNGISPECTTERPQPGDILSAPFRSLWQGLSHPGVKWQQKPFDWDAYERVQLSGGFTPGVESFAFASYAVIGNDYLHFHLRFGYHFTILDVLCGENPAENHCMLRFAGGGGDYEHRSLRIDFIARVLERLGLTVEHKGDLLEARLAGIDKHPLLEALDMIGRLLGAAKLMDMVLDSDEMVRTSVQQFFLGKYSFSERG